MCNACGFACCAFDGFEECGCTLCHDPKCWPPDEDGDEEYGVYAWDEDEGATA